MAGYVSRRAENVRMLQTLKLADREHRRHALESDPRVAALRWGIEAWFRLERIRKPHVNDLIRHSVNSQPERRCETPRCLRFDHVLARRHLKANIAAERKRLEFAGRHAMRWAGKAAKPG